MNFDYSTEELEPLFTADLCPSDYPTAFGAVSGLRSGRAIETLVRYVIVS